MILGWLRVTGVGGGDGKRKLEAGRALRGKEWVQAGQAARPTGPGDPQPRAAGSLVPSYAICPTWTPGSVSAAICRLGSRAAFPKLGSTGHTPQTAS